MIHYFHIRKDSANVRLGLRFAQTVEEYKCQRPLTTFNAGLPCLQSECLSLTLDG
jgi:hypothetical protein